MSGLPHPVDVVLGQHLRALREAQNLSMQELADRCRISAQQMMKYETGANRVSFSRLVEIAVALHLPLQQLLPPSLLGDAG